MEKTYNSIEFLFWFNSFMKKKKNIGLLTVWWFFKCLNYSHGRGHMYISSFKDGQYIKTSLKISVFGNAISISICCVFVCVWGREIDSRNVHIFCYNFGFVLGQCFFFSVSVVHLLIISLYVVSLSLFNWWIIDVISQIFNVHS